jgi:arabinose-5-phosphate isomerase
LLFECRGRVILTGMGKSGLICRKIAATLSSTGTAAFFLHPAEAIHGDLGVIQADDVVVALSYSGETEEIVRVLETIRRLGARLLAITGAPRSTLGQAADVAIDCSVAEEACPMNLVPTASTTAALALGDALAMALLVRKGFREEDFASLHPGGTIGNKLAYRVGDLMISGEELPLADIEAPMGQVIEVMSARRQGIAVITDHGRLAGVITDGDLRRLLQRVERPLEVNARQALNYTSRDNAPRSGALTVDRNAYAAAAVNLMEKHIVTALVVVDPEERPIGLIRWIDLSVAGVV